MQKYNLHVVDYLSGGHTVRKGYFFTVAALFVAFILSGCAQSNIVHLSYPPADGGGTHPTRQRRVCVVDLENLRPKHEIGSRLNGEPLLPRTPVERWMALGLAEELRRAGYSVTMAETMDDALRSGADYIVTGEALEVRLTESSLTRFTATVRANITLLDGRGNLITSNGYNSVFSRTVLPVMYRRVPQTLLDEALVEMLHPAVELLVKMMP